MSPAVVFFISGFPSSLRRVRSSNTSDQESCARATRVPDSASSIDTSPTGPKVAALSAFFNSRVCALDITGKMASRQTRLNTFRGMAGITSFLRDRSSWICVQETSRDETEVVTPAVPRNYRSGSGWELLCGPREKGSAQMADMLPAWLQ